MTCLAGSIFSPNNLELGRGMRVCTHQQNTLYRIDHGGRCGSRTKCARGAKSLAEAAGSVLAGGGEGGAHMSPSGRPNSRREPVAPGSRPDPLLGYRLPVI